MKPRLNWSNQFGLLGLAYAEGGHIVEVANAATSSDRPSSSRHEIQSGIEERIIIRRQESPSAPILSQQDKQVDDCKTMLNLYFIISSILFFTIPLFRLLFKEEALKFRRKGESSRTQSTSPARICWRRSKAAKFSLKSVAAAASLVLSLKLLINFTGPRYHSVVQAEIQLQQAAGENAFYTNGPQPLVYNGFSHEPGSGDGPPNAMLGHFNQMIPPNQYSSSSSVSPSLITAKCWNNYENDDDCKHINVITGSNNNNDLGQRQQDDDSIITPVVIFEASSSIEPAANTPPVYLAPPYFSSTVHPNTDNVVLARHRTPPSASERFTTTPPGATIVPVEGGRDSYKQNGKAGSDQSVTWPATSVFVATPAPKPKAHKTTTMGRKCRDENDADCDEPEEDADTDEDKTRTGTDDGRNEPDDNGDDDDDDDDESDGGGGAEGADGSASRRPNIDGGPAQGAGSLSGYNQNEIGSGDGPRDDNEDDDDGGADEGDDSLESSGGSDPSLVEHTTRYVEVSSIVPSTERSANNIEQPPPDAGNSNRAGAEIEVVVHPTLPPSFPITTTTTSTSTVNLEEPITIRSSFEQSYSSSTMMPEDTFTSKPVFPSTNQPNGDDLPSNQSKGDSYDSTAETNADGSENLANRQAELDLATFRSIPMPAVESESLRPPVRPGNSSSTESSSESNENKAVDSKYKFEPNSLTAAPIKFDSPWRIPTRVAASSSQTNQPAGGLATGEQAWPQQQRPRRPQESRTISEASQSRAQADLLPTLLLYAAILILIVTTVIFAIMVTFWRRNTAKRRALLHKSRMMADGGDQGGNLHQVPGSISHPSQLVTNIQQPGLLSTYAPGKGMTMGKITTSIANASDEHIGVEVDEDDEGRLLNDANGEELSNETHQDGSSIGNNTKPNDQRLQARTSSWSTEDHTTSSGSQKTDNGQQAMVGQHSPMNNQQQQLQSANRPQYPNSLSNGRQNSSSISDSQGSPDVRDGLMMGGHAQQQQSHQQKVALTNQYSTELQNYAHHQPQHQTSVRYDGQTVVNQHYNQPPVIHEGIKGLNLSRSVEDMQQAGLVDMNDIQARYMMGAPPPPPPQARYQMAPHPQIMNNGQQPPAIFKHANHPQDIQRAYLTNPRPIRQQTVDGYLNDGPNHRYGPRAPPVVNGGSRAEFQFAPVPIDPAHVAFNPLATLGRRYQPGLGLNRNIYSEDSSSLMTASPSLVRTSSSSSFAFNGSQASSIRAKPLVDAAGRTFNDYTQTGYNSSDTPPIIARKDPSEPWYV